MNIFELNVVATPLAGAIGAATATKGQPTGTAIICTVFGLLAGIAIHFGYIGIMVLVEKASGRNPDGTKNMDRSGLFLSLLIFPMTVLPIMTAWGMHHAVNVILK